MQSERRVWSEAETLEAIAAHAGLVIVDFDETLYLRNSTEDFLDTAVPGYLAAMMLRSLDLVAPWRWSGGVMTRDFWRVRAVMLVLPWTMRRWRRVCGRKGAARVNARLLAALGDKEFVIASNGFRPVIAPLLAPMGCGDARVIACGLRGAADRAEGKRRLIETALGAAALRDALVVSDSADDEALFAQCGQACLTRWSDAAYERALSQIYLPGDYLAQVKRPEQAGVLRQLLSDDLCFWLLLSLTAPGPVWGRLPGVACLFASLWSVYETGYRDNDVCALAYEVDPVVAPEFAAYGLRHFEIKAWASALGFSVVGVAIVHPHGIFAAAMAWAFVLLLLRAVFAWYNRIDKASRVWLYPALQFMRSMALLAVLPLGAVGVVAGLCQLAARWQGYFIYRYLRGVNVFEWPKLPVRAIQAVLMVCGFAALAASGARPAFVSWQAGAFLAWGFLLARRELGSVFRGGRRIDKGPGLAKSKKML